MSAKRKSVGALLLALSIAPVSAYGSVHFDPPPIETRFDEAREVCICTVISLRESAGAAVSPNGQAIGGYEAKVAVNGVFKGQFAADRPITVKFSGADIANGPPVNPGNSYLMFLSEDVDGGLFVPDMPGSIASIAAHRSEGSAQEEGVSGLEDEIRREVMASRSDTELKSALEILLQFKSLHADTLRLMDRLTASRSPDVRLLSLAVSAKSGSSQPQADAQSRLRVSRLLTDLAKSSSGSSQRREEIAEVVSDDSTVEQLGALESLAGNPLSPYRLDAMRGIRRIRSSDSLGFLMRMLDSADPNIQYQSVIALAELNGLFGDYAPSMGVFEAQPAKYLALWKEWGRQRSVEKGPNHAN